MAVDCPWPTDGEIPSPRCWPEGVMFDVKDPPEWQQLSTRYPSQTKRFIDESQMPFANCELLNAATLGHYKATDCIQRRIHSNLCSKWGWSRSRFCLLIGKRSHQELSQPINWTCVAMLEVGKTVEISIAFLDGRSCDRFVPGWMHWLARNPRRADISDRERSNQNTSLLSPSLSCPCPW